MAFPGHRGNRSGRVAVRATAAIGLGLVATLVACGGNGQEEGVVRLIPATPSRSATWSWSASCPFTPRAPIACRSTYPILGTAELAGDEWNLGAAPATSGSVGMSLDREGGLEFRGNLPDAPPCTEVRCIAPDARTWVRGYPSVLYGINQCNAGTSAVPASTLRLPMRVDEIPADLIGTTSYRLDATGVTYDLAYDLWLNDTPTRDPCRTSGTIEVMIWTGYDSRAVLPASLAVGTATAAFSIDGSAHSGRGAWTVYASNIGADGRTVPWGGTLWFVLDPQDARRAGTVHVDISTILEAAGTVLRHSYGWHSFERTYWLDTVPFGMEFGPASGTLTGGGPSDFALDLSAFCLQAGTTVSSASC